MKILLATLLALLPGSVLAANPLWSLTSPDGLTWTYHESVMGGDISYGDITYGNHQFVGVFGIYLPSRSWIVTSSDGVNWTRHGDFYQALHGIDFGNGRFTIVGDWGAILQSGPIINLMINQQPATGLLSLSLQGPIGLNYTIQATSDLSTWLDVTRITGSPSGKIVSDGLQPAEGRRFYRAEAR
jgi:hypothetical protein